MKRGFTLIEVMISIVILSIVALAAMQSMSFVSRQGHQSRERTFAAQKSIQLVEELRGLSQAEGLDALDALDDGEGKNPLLTLNKTAAVEGALSGNEALRFLRQIRVQRIPGEPDVRRVEVRVYRAKDAELLSETVTLLRRQSESNPPSQVYDLYLLAVENVAGSGTNLSELRPSFETVLHDFEIRNPGLEFRTHWIERLAIGRDPWYTPIINQAKLPTEMDAFAGAYFYMGRTESNGSANIQFFASDRMNGRRSVDGAAPSGVLSMADQYNHALRYPEERDAALGLAEPTWRMLIEEMSRGQSRKNIILMNLHGGVLPLPPLRNYSDPAKDPSDPDYRNVRVVTHPERLWYPIGAGGNSDRSVKLRVYSYLTASGMASPPPAPDITLRLPAGITEAQVSVRRMRNNFSQWEDPSPGEAQVQSVGGRVLVRLRNSGLLHAEDGTQGLDENARLYGLEYIPCLVAAAGEFVEGARDLSDLAADVPKNTARWVVHIATGAFGASGVERMVETWLGTSDNPPAEPTTNLSKTYFWVSGSEESVPITERYQYMGDPRHMPYADVKARHGYNWFFVGSPIRTSGMDGTQPGMQYEGFDQYVQVSTAPYGDPLLPVIPIGWRTGFPAHLALDVARYNDLVRGSLMNVNGVLGLINGMAGVLSVGGEFGGNWWTGHSMHGIRAREQMWGPDENDNTLINVDESSRNTMADQDRLRLIRRRDGSWTCFPWLGELYPDDAFARWTATGNLPSRDPSGSGLPANAYYRARYDGFFSQQPSVDAALPGGVSFMRGNETGTYSAPGYTRFSLLSPNQVGEHAAITEPGRNAASTFNLSIPSSIRIGSGFNLNYASPYQAYPQEWNSPPYTHRYLLTLVEKHLEPSAFLAPVAQATAGLITISSGIASADNPAAHVSMNGLALEVTFGPTQLSRLTLSNTMRSFLRLGGPDIPNTRGWIQPVPRVEIEDPLDSREFSNPSAVDIRWNARWALWDDGNYGEFNTPAYSGPLADLVFNVKYSADKGATWRCVQNGTAAEEGVPHADSVCQVMAGASPINLSWAVPAGSFPAGVYDVRVEAFTKNRRSHYAHHTARIRILR